MKTVASHKFANNKAIRIDYLNRTDQKKLGLPECDSLTLVRVDDGTERATYISPIEAIIIVRLLAEALDKTVREWKIGLRK